MNKNFRYAILFFTVALILSVTVTATHTKHNTADSKPVYAESQYRTEGDSSYAVYGELMENLAEKYPDICGWINIENTNICYPLLISGDNEYYLRRSYDGSSNKNGSIIVDYRLSRVLNENRNIILYGHNMASGNMFSYLSEPENFINAEIEIYSNGVLTIYKPFAAYIEGGNEFIQTALKDEEDIKNYIATALGKTIIEFETTPEGNEYILTLVTCEDSFSLNDKRIVIHAVRQEPTSP